MEEKITLSKEILNCIQEGRKLNQNAPKRIIYFVGPSACGKTTKIKTLEKFFGGYYQYITLKESTSLLGDQTSVFIRSLVYLQKIWEELINAIQTAAKTNQNTIFVDGHPILSVFQCESAYRLINSRKITEKQFKLIKGIYREIVDYINSNNTFKDFQQVIYYINIPLKENLRLLQKKEDCKVITEDEKTKLISFRNVIHSNIFELINYFTGTKVIEVNTVGGLEIIHMYLLGFSGCG